MDERSEIAACYRGVPQNDVGMRTDVLDAVLEGERNGNDASFHDIRRYWLWMRLAAGRSSRPSTPVINCGCWSAGYSTWRILLEKLELRSGTSKDGERKVFERYVILDRRKRSVMWRPFLNADRDYLYQNDRCRSV
ncbi:MAG: hypothetical protein ACLR1V_08645 [Coprococcus sp.]